MLECDRRRLHSSATWVMLLMLATFSVRVADAQVRTAPSLAPRPVQWIAFEAPVAAEWVLTLTAADGLQRTSSYRFDEPVMLPGSDDAAPLDDGEYSYSLRSEMGASMVGRFNVAGGYVETLSSPTFAFDQVIPDDLIVQASLCVGFDCVNNESFGFDTIRLKENNLRIHFEDTSTSPGFPTNDWEIQANASQSGGDSYFGVIDRNTGNLLFRLDAGAPVDSMRLSSAGRLGLQTSPVLDIHARTGNTPAIRLEQSTAGGFGAQTWDIGSNEANFFVRDVTGGSRLPFRVRPGAPTSSLDISAAGNVGIGTASPATKLHVVGGARVEGVFNLTSVAIPGPPAAGAMNAFFATGDRVRFQFSDGSQPFRIVPGGFSAGGGVDVDGLLRIAWGTGAPTPSVGTIFVWHDSADGSLRFRMSSGTTAQLSPTGAWTDGSSRAFKNNIRPLGGPDAAAALRTLAPVRYFHNGTSDERVGFIAEDVPDLVATEGREGVAPMDIVGVLTKVVQDQQARIEGLAAEIAALKAALEQLRGVRIR